MADIIGTARTAYMGYVTPAIMWFNGLLTKLIPGKEEFVILAIALFIGWKIRGRMYVQGGYGYWLKASGIVYLILKIMGFGINLLALIKL